MATDHWVINNKNYLLIWEAYQESYWYPKSIDRSLAGTSITYIPQGASWAKIKGMIYVPYSPQSGYGSINDLKAAYEAQTQILVTNHRGLTMDAVITSLDVSEISPLANEGYYASLTIEETP